MRLRDAPWAPNKKIIVAKGEKMKMSLDCRVLLGCALLVFALSPRPAHAALQYAYWDFQVTEMEIVNDGTNNAVPFVEHSPRRCPARCKASSISLRTLYKRK